MIRCVVFDVGSVLVRYQCDTFYDLLRTHTSRKEVKSIAAIREYFTAAEGPFADYELGKIDTARFFDFTNEYLGLTGLSREAFFCGFGSVLQPDFEMSRIKQLLAESGIQLALLTNNDPLHMEIIPHRWPSVFSFFKVVVTSYDAGSRKPEPRIYQVLFDRLKKELQIKPNECLFVDDLEVNVKAFREFGGMGYHYDVGRRKDTIAPEDRTDSERAILYGMFLRLGIIKKK